MTQPDVQAQAAMPGYPAAPGHPAAQGYPAAPGYPVAYLPPPPGRFTRMLTRAYARAPGWLAPAAVLGCFAAAAAYVLYTDPAHADADAVPTCLVKLTTGFDCPGCGGTRAFYYALHGNIPAAARHHAVFVFALPFLVYLYVAWASDRVFHRRLPQPRITGRMIGVFLAAWGVFAVARNLPWAPFNWLYV